MSETDSDMAIIDEPVFGKWVIGFWKPTPAWGRVALMVAWGVSMVVFWYGSRVFSVPPLSRYDGSLFCNPSPVLGVITTAILLLVCTLLGTVLAGAVRFEAGFFAGTLGMLAITLRSGTMRSVIFETGGVSSVYFKLAGEMFVLGAIMAGAWMMLVMLGRMARKHDAAQEQEEKPAIASLLLTLGVQILATGIVVEFLVVNEAKNQVLGAIFTGSVLGAVAAYYTSPTRHTWCYWAGPLVLGFIGYLMAGSGMVTGVANGNLAGTFAPLARSLPLDYASVGPAGALIGYWLARSWSTNE